MRNQPLTGYVLHQKPYQDHRSLTYFFSQERGLVHGIGKKNLPLFSCISLFASGKNSLKNFSQSQLTAKTCMLNGQGQFAGLYLNELLLKLLPVEESSEHLWQAYDHCLAQIHSLYQIPPLDATMQSQLLKFYLRQFETELLNNLGYGVDFYKDALGDEITQNQSYYYQLQRGFMPADTDTDTEPSSAILLAGEAIYQWRHVLQHPEQLDLHSQQSSLWVNQTINLLSKIYKQVIDDLVNYETLQSRELWHQLAQFGR